jgi:AraC-like DNA-binding protein
MDESLPLKQLFTKSQSGVKIGGEAKTQVLFKLDELLHAKNLEKIICLLDILNTISNADSVTCVAEKNFITHSNSTNRLTRLFDFIDANYQHPIRLKEAARITNMTAESFCRFFKQKTGKNFVDYLQETRMSRACHSLLNTDNTVAEIAYQTGFKTASNFNKLFRKFNGNSPTEYRKTILRSHQ